MAPAGARAPHRWHLQRAQSWSHAPPSPPGVSDLSGWLSYRAGGRSLSPGHAPVRRHSSQNRCPEGSAVPGAEALPPRAARALSPSTNCRSVQSMGCCSPSGPAAVGRLKEHLRPATGGPRTGRGLGWPRPIAGLSGRRSWAGSGAGPCRRSLSAVLKAGRASLAPRSGQPEDGANPGPSAPSAPRSRRRCCPVREGCPDRHRGPLPLADRQ